MPYIVSLRAVAFYKAMLRRSWLYDA